MNVIGMTIDIKNIVKHCIQYEKDNILSLVSH